ncbi:DUF1810 domain-containing protein [Pedobacter jejuensis]|uniref:DUF1810 domain-containing protein n=1 Tax=Pedobacter jejuensis TaxID=1268550 RepID=A0A3N0C2N7_9SPHI|nr:DUF1810 domain-containing protein [Pedobacter jejuensis]RNL56543.1 DUF1810 domain-containing protein [Pedobacter jejuensis]
MEYNLDRFVEAQHHIYSVALKEIKNGRKTSHWMWFIFPQLDGLGYSDMAKKFAIRDISEAEAYLNHPILGNRLIEITKTLNGLGNLSAEEIFGGIDAVKLRSSMTLFATLKNINPVFETVLIKFFDNEKDSSTLALLNK